jgi:hypothetical protein
MTEKISVEDATNEYYRLKNVYETSYYEKYIKPIVKAEKKSKREKRVEYSKLPKAECVNCKRNVGTTFSILGKSSERVFTVKCGDINAPCPLNINIVSAKYNTFANEINTYGDDIDQIKTNIIKEKYNIMFGYTPEENGINNFTSMSTELKDTSMLAGYVIEKNILVNSNPEKEELLRKSVTIFGNDYLTQFKQMVDQFNQDGNEAIMTEAAKFYADEMVPRLKEIQGLKYDECYIEYDQDSLEYKLYQIKNSLSNLETTDSSNAKVVSFVTGLKETGTKAMAEDKTQKKKKKKKLEFIIEDEEEVVLPDSPVYVPNSPEYNPDSPVYVPNSPEYNPDSPVYVPNSPEYNPDSPPQSNNNFIIHGDEVTWTDSDPDYALIWRALSPKYKAILVQDPAWMRKTMDEFVAIRQTPGNVSRDFVIPDDILLPPKVSEETKELDFGNPVLNDLVARLALEQRNIVIDALPKKETSNEEDFKPMFGILKHMLKKVVDFRS